MSNCITFEEIDLESDTFREEEEKTKPQPRKKEKLKQYDFFQPLFKEHRQLSFFNEHSQLSL